MRIEAVNRFHGSWLDLAGGVRAGDEITPAVRSLQGVLRGSDVDEGDYRRYLEGKYL